MEGTKFFVKYVIGLGIISDLMLWSFLIGIKWNIRTDLRLSPIISCCLYFSVRFFLNDTVKRYDFVCCVVRLIKTQNLKLSHDSTSKKKRKIWGGGVIYLRETDHFTDGGETDRPSLLPLIVPWSIFWATGAESRRRRQEKCGEKCPH